MVDIEKNHLIISGRHLMSVYKIIYSLKPKLNRCAIIGAIYILVIVFRKPIFMYDLYKLICMRVGVYSLYIKKVLLLLANISCLDILLCCFMSLVISIEKLFWDWQNKKRKGDSRFEQSALRYMQEKGSPHCFLVSGEWGSGKTYEVNEFLNKYYFCSSVNTYRVSCFGLSTRREVIEEINRTIERSDNSLYKTINDIIWYLPAIGKPISKMIGRSYSYDKAKKGSIFVFDDFERITSRTYDDIQLPYLYKKDVFLDHNIRDGGLGDPRAIDREFEQVERAFKHLRDENACITDRADCDKYIAIAGLINELIETYKMKVFIICNTGVVGEKFIHDVLRSKLNCIEYRKVTTNAIRESVINQLISNTVFEDSKKQTITRNFFRLMSRRLNDVVLEHAFGNLRLFSGLFEALINEVALIDNKYLTMDFLESLFQSIILTHLLYYNNNLSLLESFKNGMNIAIQLKLYDHNGEYTWLAKESYDYKWVDLALSAHWICNLAKPFNTNSILKQWNEYEYSQLEKSLNEDYLCIENTDKYTLLHILFIQRVYGKDAQWNYKKAIKNVLEEYDLTRIDTIQNILDIAYALMNNPINTDFYNELCQALQKGNAEGEIVGLGYIYELYRSMAVGKKRGPATGTEA